MEWKLPKYPHHCRFEDIIFENKEMALEWCIKNLLHGVEKHCPKIKIIETENQIKIIRTFYYLGRNVRQLTIKKC